MARRIDPSLVPLAPTLEFEQAFWARGLTAVAGIDEVGRGALAGPVYAAAVAFSPCSDLSQRLKGVRDSKCMTPGAREAWAPVIREHARGWSIGQASAAEVDEIGIVPATRLAAQRALETLSIPAEHLLIDAINLPEVATPQTSLYRGDARALSIAAASVLAKVSRDAELCALDCDYPQYGFARHKGYATEFHLRALEKYGPSPLHRLSFAPMRSL